MNERSPQLWEIWHARFNFSEGKGYKYRPVIVVGTNEDASIAIMVTSATNKLHLKHDYPIRNWREASLKKPSVARVDRIAQIPAGYLGTAGFIGRLDYIDRHAIAKILRDITKE